MPFTEEQLAETGRRLDTERLEREVDRVHREPELNNAARLLTDAGWLVIRENESLGSGGWDRYWPRSEEVQLDGDYEVYAPGMVPGWVNVED